MSSVQKAETEVRWARNDTLCSSSNSECLFVAPRPAGRAGKRAATTGNSLAPSSDKVQFLAERMNLLEHSFSSSLANVQQAIDSIASRVGVENIPTMSKTYTLPIIETEPAMIANNALMEEGPHYAQTPLPSDFRERNSVASKSDLISKGIISEKEAKVLYDFFYQKCRSTISFFDDTVPLLEVARQTPLYLAAICTIAARGSNAQLYRACLSELENLIKESFSGPTPTLLMLKGIMLFSAWYQRTRLFGFAMSVALELSLNSSVLQLENDDILQSEEDVDRARTWLSLCVFDLVSNLNRPFLISRLKEYLPLSKKLLSSPHFRNVDYRIQAWIEAFTIAADAKGKFKDPKILQSRPMAEEISNLLTSFDERVDAWFYKVNNSVDPLYQTFPCKQDRNRLMVPYGFIRMYINGFALHGVKPGESINDPARILFVQKAVESAKLILRTQLESSNLRHSLRYAFDYLAIGTYLAVSFLLKAVTAVHRHLDVHGINDILRQVIKMFDEAKIPESAMYVRGVSEAISDIMHTTLSPRDEPLVVEGQGELFDINNWTGNPSWHEEFPYVDIYSLD